MNVPKISKRLKMTHREVVRFYLLSELTFFRRLDLISSDLDLLTLLALHGEQELPSFCTLAAKHFHPQCAPEDLATREQNVRNRLVKLEKRRLVSKRKPGTKTLVSLTKELQVPTGQHLLIDYQLLGLASA